MLLIGGCEPLRYLSLLRSDTIASVGDTLQVEAVYGTHGPAFAGHVVADSRADPQQFVWHTSDSSVARVDGTGTVLALHPGVSRISAEHNGYPADRPLTVTVCSSPVTKVAGGTCPQ